MKRINALDFYAKVFRLLLELDHVHYDNNTERPYYYFSHEDLLRGRDEVDELMFRLRSGGLGDTFCIEGFVITLMKSLADDIEYAVVYDSTYAITDDAIREELDWYYKDSNGDLVCAADADNDDFADEAYNTVEENRVRAKEGALRVAAQLRDLANSVEC